MCGILGLWQRDGGGIEPTVLQRATERLRHRGPDDEGYLLAATARGWVQPYGGPDTALALRLPILPPTPLESVDLALGFRRLSILDLSPAGHQPMASPDGRHWLVLNGEIYNYRELRRELAAQGVEFRSGTDTEVVLAAYRLWGTACVARFNGMWAFAVWDAAQRLLFCARDRFGIKPFYYWLAGPLFAFASELKGLLALPGAPRKPNDPLIYDFLTAGLLDHTEETCFAGLRALPPAHSLLVRVDGVEQRPYWSLDLERRAEPGDQAGQFVALFEDAVRLHLRSDVAVGTCLSGGLDSSAIVSVANRLLRREGVIDPALVGDRQKTFSACFADPRFDERQHIAHVLAATGAEANFVFPNPAQLLDDLPRLIWHQEEPFGSTSIFAQWCVMRRAAERGVRVLLDGQGADELLAGYHGYFDYYWGGLLEQGRLTRLRHELAAYRALYGPPWPRLLGRVLRPFLPSALLPLIRRLWRGGGLGLHPDFTHLYRHRRWDDRPAGSADRLHGALSRALTHTSLPALLRYEDRNSMAFSIEARVPFLDYRLVEFLFGLPAEAKISAGYTKAVMRRALQGVLPEPIRTRTDKMGFVTPESVWIAGPLRDWLRDIAASASFRARPYFNARQVQTALDDHAAGRRDLGFLPWRWACVELWLRQWIDEEP